MTRQSRILAAASVHPSPRGLPSGAGRGTAPEQRLAPWADETPLPCWADNEPARTLLAAIIAERPETNIYDNCGWQGSEYAGVNAAKLRRVYRDWLGERIAGNLTGDAYETMRAEVVAVDTADRLIRRLLA